jgi:ribosome biogenesis SPOUT family RNA methylase Rps3
MFTLEGEIRLSAIDFFVRLVPMTTKRSKVWILDLQQKNSTQPEARR